MQPAEGDRPADVSGSQFFLTRLLCTSERELIYTGSLGAHGEQEREGGSRLTRETTPAAAHSRAHV